MTTEVREGWKKGRTPKSDAGSIEMARAKPDGCCVPTAIGGALTISSGPPRQEGKEERRKNYKKRHPKMLNFLCPLPVLRLGFGSWSHQDDAIGCHGGVSL
jgi:hypothetical protein